MPKGKGRTVTSKAQMRFMQAVAHGAKPRGGEGPTPAQAREMIAETKTPARKLPARKRR